MGEDTYRNKNLDRIRNIDTDNFINYLSSAYEVLRKIFSYLSLEDLETVSRAFDSWKSVAETIKKERTEVESFVVYSESEKFDIWTESSFSITFFVRRNRSIEDMLRKYCKKNSQFLLVESRAGVIGTCHDLSKLVQHPKSNFLKSFYSSVHPYVHLRIPSIPNVGIKTFEWKPDTSFEELKNQVRVFENQIIKCLIILMISENVNYGNTISQKDDFVTHLRTIQSEEFAVGGCFVDSLPDNIVTKYIIFYGDKVEAASTLLERKTNTKKKIEVAVEEFREMCPKTNKGLLFVFRCCSRSQLSAKAVKNLIIWEGDSLSKFFPTTPVIGCCGYGEFGRKFPEESKPKLENKVARMSNIWEYTYSTSLVYLGFKN